MLFLFGSSEELEETKNKLRAESDQAKGDDAEGFITTTPLDYHLFRQEITSKYPAYDPPPPLVPIEPENNSILPPLPNHPSRRMSHENLSLTAGPNINGSSGSIFNQPVHIATPAPSPPPSPAGPGGKGGKKQNYQTNQNFPFLYPPLDETSNVVGGDHSSKLQDQLVGKRWEGSDVPASILEAGQLFASRMRMSRSIRQLWDVRERFIRNERGWDESSKNSASEGSNVSDISTFEEDEALETDGQETTAKVASKDHIPESLVKSRIKAKRPTKETDDDKVQQRLDAIEQFYVSSCLLICFVV